MGSTDLSGDDLGPDDFFPDRQTARIMAFDVAETPSGVADNAIPRHDANSIPTPEYRLVNSVVP
jgi:hypothetical protein